MVSVSEAAQLRAEIAAVRRRRDRARGTVEQLKSECESLRVQLGGGSSLPASPAQSPATEQQAQVGERVRIHGLAEAQHLNGQDAEVIAKDGKKGRCKVRLAQTGEQRQIPVTNLQPLTSQAAAALENRTSVPTTARSNEKPRFGNAPPLLSCESLRLRSVLPSKVGGHPCELLPLIFSSLARAQVSDSLVDRLRQQLDVASRHVSALDYAAFSHGEIRSGCQVKLEHVDAEFKRVLIEMCNLLAWGLFGDYDFRCELETVWGVVQKEGDYSPIQTHRCKKAPTGFSAILDVEMPPSLSQDNHERPPKGAYGFHDGIHNLLWKTDRTTDQDDLVQPGIIQLELVTGFLYVYPQWFKHLTYPFDGPGERKWIAASIALTSTSPDA